LKQNERFCRKWHQDYISLLIREDMRDISKVVDLDKIEALVFLVFWISHEVNSTKSSKTLAEKGYWWFLEPFALLFMQL